MKTKLNKIMGVLVTLAITASLLIAVVPVSAADQSWSQVKTPSTTGNVIAPSGYDFVGPFVKSGDVLYVAAGKAGTSSYIFKSTNDGRTWTWLDPAVYTTVPTPAVTFFDMMAGPAVGTLYVTDGINIWKTVDAGATWVVLNVLGAGTIRSLAMGVLGGNTYLFAGTTTGAYFANEAVIGMPWSDMDIDGSAGARNGGLFTAADVYDIVLSPTFGTDQMVMALVYNGTNVVLTTKYSGAKWAATVADVTIIPAATLIAGSIFLPGDFSSSFASGKMQVLVGANASNPALGDVYWAIFGAPGVAYDMNVAGVVNGFNVSGMSGSGNIGSAKVLVIGADSSALTVPVVYNSANFGTTWTKATKSPTGGASFWTGRALGSILLLSGTTAIAGTHGLDSAVSFSKDGAFLIWNQISLIQTPIDSIDDLAWSGANLFMTTSATTVTTPAVPGVAGDAFRVTATNSGDSVVLTGVLGGIYASITPVGTSALPAVAITANGSGTAAVLTPTYIWLGSALDQATISAVADGTAFNIEVTGLGILAETLVPGVDNNANVFIGHTVSLVMPLRSQWNVVLPDDTNDRFTFTVTGGEVTVTGTGAGVYPAPFGATTVTFANAGDTSTLTATQISTTGVTAITGGAPTPSWVSDVDGDASTTVYPGAYTLPDAAVIAVPAVTATTSALWRHDGTNWERVKSGMTTPTGSTWAVEASPANDAIFLANVTQNDFLLRSLDNGDTFKAQGQVPGAAISAWFVASKDNVLVGGAANVVRITTTNGAFWLPVTVGTTFGTIVDFAISGTTLAAASNTGKLALSTDMGNTWGTATDALAGGLPGGKIAFQNGSTSVIWATSTNGGVYNYDFSATTPAWSTAKDVNGSVLDSSANSTVVTGNGIAAGKAGSNFVVYAMDGSDGYMSRIKSNDTAAGASYTGASTARGLWINAAEGANQVWTIRGGNKIYTYTDKFAVAIANVADVAASITTSGLKVSWDAINVGTYTTDTTLKAAYKVFVKAGTSAQKNPYSGTTAGTVVVDNDARTATITGLAAGTEYTISVWAVEPVTSFYGSHTIVTTLASPSFIHPSSDVLHSQQTEITPSFQWSEVTGATGYELWVATKADFSDAQKFTTTLPAYTWTGTALKNGSSYYAQVRATSAAPANTSAWALTVFSTEVAQLPAVTVPAPTTFTTTSTTINIPTQTAAPVPTINLPQPTVIVNPAPITVTIPPGTTLPAPTLVLPEAETPVYIWIIVAVGALLTVAVIVLIIRTRRVV